LEIDGIVRFHQNEKRSFTVPGKQPASTLAVQILYEKHALKIAAAWIAFRSRPCLFLSRMRLSFLALVALVLGSLSAMADTATAVRFLERKVQDDPGNYIAWNQLASRYLTLLRDGGNEEQLTKAEQAVAASLKALGPPQNAGALAVRAAVEMAGHRFGDALATAVQFQPLASDQAAAWQLIADARIGLGDYSEAETAVLKLAELGASAAVIEPRLARLDLALGRTAGARTHFESTLKAVDDGPPEIRAWVLVQLGELAFRSGDWETAERHYTAALAARPDDIAAQEHMAELRGAAGRLEEAATLFQAVIEKTGRPEFCQALGDLYAFAKSPEKARPWHQRAEAGYLASVKAGHVLYFHHLAGFYADSQPDPLQALAWARRDLELRHSLEAWDALAWALYQNNQFSEAVEAAGRALASGTSDAHVLYHAGLIRMSAGDLTGGKAALRQTVSANPRHAAFHVHR
jgi:tetratricopeptide (TPR) repeat protein